MCISLAVLIIKIKENCLINTNSAVKINNISQQKEKTSIITITTKKK